MDYPQYFLNMATERLWQLININIGAATLVSYHNERFHLPIFFLIENGWQIWQSFVTALGNLPFQLYQNLTILLPTQNCETFFIKHLNKRRGGGGGALEC